MYLLSLFGCPGSLLLRACGLALVVVSGGCSSSRCKASRCRASRCGAPALRREGVSGFGTQAQLLHGRWGLPGPGVKSVSPALQGQLLTREAPEQNF